MPRPGTDIVLTDAAGGGGGGEVDTGQAFMVGVAERGPVDQPARVRSLRDYEARFGGRSGGAVAHDSVRAFFTERGGNMRFLRLSGPLAAPAEAEMGVLAVSASSPGTWGNSVTVSLASDVSALIEQVAVKRKAAPRKAATREGDNGDNGDNGNTNGDPPEPVRVVVRRDGEVVERSRPLTTAGEAEAWARGTSYYLDIEAEIGHEEDALEPTTTAKALTGGRSDPNVTPTVVKNALGRFEYTLGFAQVLYPGATDYDTHMAVLEHCERNRRPALLDLNDLDPATIAADVVALQHYSGSRFAAALAPRLQYPGPAAGTTVLVPYSAVQAGVLARADRQTGNPNEAAAGTNGESISAQGLSREFDDYTREQLNELGVTLARLTRSNVVRTYGSRTVVSETQPNWQWFPGSRTVLAMAHQFDNAAEEFVHRQIDGARRLFSRLEVALGGICLEWFNLGALYGEEPEEGFSVDTGPGVNTDATIAAGEVHALVRVRTSPPAEWVVIEIAKTPLSMAV